MNVAYAVNHRPLMFPEDFVWGAATDADASTPSVWDTGLMKELGLVAYRFSVSWPKVQSDGPVCLDRYERLADELLGLGVTPMITLSHGDVPRAPAEAGGWTVRDTAARFAEYAELVAARLGDRVRHFTTLDEPWCAAFLGHAPSRTDPAPGLRAAHHLLLAHGLATRALRSVLPAGAQLSISLGLAAVLPAVTSSAATGAVRRIDGLANRLFLDPLLAGHYPADVRADTSRLSDWSFVREGDVEVISTPIDLLGIDYHSPMLVDVGAAMPGPSPWPACENVRFVQPPGPTSAMGWAIDAQGMRNVVHRVPDQYRPIPLVVTENGTDHLEVLHEAITAGVDLRGYFVCTGTDG